MGFCHAHLCTNDYLYYFGFSTCTFCTNDYPCYSCTGFCDADLFTNYYPYHSSFCFHNAQVCTNDFSYYSCLGFRHAHSVRMTIHTLMGFVIPIFVRMIFHILLLRFFHHAKHCTNDYAYYFCFGFHHSHFCTNDYPHSYGILSCTFLYK